MTPDLFLAYSLVLRSPPPYPEEGDRGPLARMVAEGKTVQGLRIVTHGTEFENVSLLVIACTVRHTGLDPLRLYGLYDQAAVYNAKLLAFVKKYNLRAKGKPGWMAAVTID